MNTPRLKKTTATYTFLDSISTFGFQDRITGLSELPWRRFQARVGVPMAMGAIRTSRLVWMDLIIIQAKN